jgi:micrococcal nuclease
MHPRSSSWLLAGAAALLCAPLTPLAAQASDTVWVNTRSGVYHCRGTTYFGKTTQGEYMLEMAARGAGYRANGGRACPPPNASADDPVTRTTAALIGSTGARATAVTPPSRPTGSLAECRLVEITDGDTVKCDPIGAIRLIGIDAPEPSDAPHGPAALAALASFVPMGATLAVEKDRNDRDRFGRTLAYLWHEGQMLNWMLLRHGWGRSDPFPDTPRYHALFDATEDAARAEQRGLWRIDGLRCRPRDRQRGRC